MGIAASRGSSPEAGSSGQVIGSSRAVGELGQAIGFRHTLTCSPLSQADGSIVWRTSLSELARLRKAAVQAKRALGSDVGASPGSSTNHLGPSGSRSTADSLIRTAANLQRVARLRATVRVHSLHMYDMVFNVQSNMVRPILPRCRVLPWHREVPLQSEVWQS